MRKLKKIYIKNLKGFIYVESYNGKHNEEQERAKIYDENQNYLDYISLENTSKEQYNNFVETIKGVKDFSDLAENCLAYTTYDYCENLENLLYSIFEDWDNETIEELESNLKKLGENLMTEKELLNIYAINRIGDHYFYLGDY